MKIIFLLYVEISYLITSQHTDKDIHVFLSECRSGVPLFCIVPHTQSKYAWMRHVCIVSQNLHFVEASLLESVCLFSSSVRVRSRSSNDSITLNDFNILVCLGMRFLRRGFEDSSQCFDAVCCMGACVWADIQQYR